MAEYIPYRILVDTSSSKIDLNKELIKAVPPEYSIPSYIPPRIVEIYNYFPINFNKRIADYLLTEEEARTLLQDERIIEILPVDFILNFFTTGSTQITNFSRHFDQNSSLTGHLNTNWGLYSSTHLDIPLDSLPEIQNDQGQEIADWINFNEKYEYTLDGTGVDLVIMDSGILNPFHEEWLDPTGTYSRVVTKSWGEICNLDPADFTEVSQYSFDRIFTASYHYFPSEEAVWEANGYSSEGFDEASINVEATVRHGTQCLSIAGGRFNGWAKNATLYYLETFDLSYNFDLIRIFHENKSIDPITGFKRPTIVNQSAGGYARSSTFTSDGIYYSGSFYPGAVPSLEYGFTSDLTPSGRLASSDDPLEEMVNAGVIHIHSSMNDGQIFFRASPNTETNYPIPDRYRSIHYDNYISSSYFSSSTGDPEEGKRYYHRGASPTSLLTVEVGALNRLPLENSYSASLVTNRESPAYYSNHGGGTDIYAPSEVYVANGGVDTSRAAYYSPLPISENPFEYDPTRTIARGIEKTFIGTSFAAPQVAGVACLYFQMNPGADVWQFKQFLLDHAKPVKIPPSEDNGGPIDVWAEGNVKTEGGVEYIALNGAPTASLFWPYSSPNKVNITTSGSTPLNTSFKLTKS